MPPRSSHSPETVKPDHWIHKLGLPLQLVSEHLEDDCAQITQQVENAGPQN